MKNNYFPIEEQIKLIEKKLQLAPFFNCPGLVMLALGLYGKFAVNGDANNTFLPWLNEPKNVTQILIAGGVWVSWGIYNRIKLLRQKEQLTKELESNK